VNIVMENDSAMPVVRRFSILCLMQCKIQRRKRVLRTVFRYYRMFHLKSAHLLDFTVQVAGFKCNTL
jgi:hypothetical protein